MSHHRVHIVMESGSRRARILLDGREIKGVRNVAVEHAYGQPPRVEFDLLAATASIEYVDNLDEHQLEEVTDAAP